jgi:hypothetical protein
VEKVLVLLKGNVMKKQAKPQPKKESTAKLQTPEEFKKRHYSDVGTSVFEDLKKATNAEKEFRKGREE